MVLMLTIILFIRIIFLFYFLLEIQKIILALNI